MFNRARWWSEKNKVKEVFKLQFHASQLTHIGEDGLMISVVPADSGKPTVKLDKVPVRDGICFWGNPVYETVKFNRDSRSGKIQERIYHFIVGTGSSKFGVVGEASIDFSSYADTAKVSVVSLPLGNSKTEALLHVSIQRIQESTEQRDMEDNENGNLLSEDQSFISQFGNNYRDETVFRSNAVEDGIIESNANCQQSSGSDISISGSESSSGIETHWEPRVKNDCSATDQKAGGCILPLMPQEPKSDAPAPTFEEHARSWDWLENSRTDDSSITLTEIFPGQHSDKDIVIAKLKSEVTSLSRQVEMSDLELQTLRKQIVKETKRGQDLWKEIACLREERDALKGECRQFKACERETNEAKTTADIGFHAVDSHAMVVELRQELNHAIEMNANLRIQLQKMQESNSELILAVRDLDEMLKQQNGEMSNLPGGSLMKDAYEYSQVGGMCRLDDDDEQKALEELVKEHADAKETYRLEQQVMDLHSEIEIYKRHKDELEMQMEQLALDYEIMKQENHNLSCRLEQSQMHEKLEMQYECSSPDADAHGLEFKLENLEVDLERQSKEYADSLVKISELEVHAKSLEEELEKQTQRFEADVETLTRSKVEQEQRAVRAEETLKKLRWKNANTVERLQADFRTLSVQMTSTFEANGKVVVNALSEANQLLLQKGHLEEMLQKASEEHESAMSHYESRLHELTSQLMSMTSQMEQMQLEAEDTAVQQEHEKKDAEETQRILSEKILLLREDIEIQKAENKTILAEIGSKESLIQELEEMRKSIEEMELLVEKRTNERMEMENKVSLVKNEAEETHQELEKVRCLVKEKELAARNLQSELDSLQAQCMKLKQSLLTHELEKEKLRKQVSQLTRDLKKRDDAFKSMEKKVKDSVGRGSFDMMKVGPKATKTLSRGPKEMENLKDRIKLLEGQVEMKETALETSAKTFQETEKDLHNKIEELEAKLELLEQQCSAPKKFNAGDEHNPSCSPREETRNMTKSSGLSEDGNIDEFKNEVALLKERNKGMDKELKEMHERYSEISLKFAEVEGERQQLVMTLRNLKNSNKIA